MLTRRRWAPLSVGPPFTVCPAVLLLDFKSAAIFDTLFRELENQKAELAFESWSVGVCNLEEVFLKVASEGHNGEERLQMEKVNSAARRCLELLVPYVCWKDDGNDTNDNDHHDHAASNDEDDADDRDKASAKDE